MSSFTTPAAKKQRIDGCSRVFLKSNDSALVALDRDAARGSKVLDYAFWGVESSSSEFATPADVHTVQLLVSELEGRCELDLSCLASDSFFKLCRLSKFLDCEHVSLKLCCHLASRLRGKSPRKIREEFNIRNDLTVEEEEAALKEHIFTLPSEQYSNNTVVSGGALAPSDDSGGPPQIGKSLSHMLFNEDAISELLQACEIRTLRTLKGVSDAWRDRARFALSNVSSAWRTNTFAPRSELAAGIELARIDALRQDAKQQPLPADPPSEKPTGGAGWRRLRKEWLDIKKDRDAYVEENILSVAPENDWTRARCHILGPAGTLYAGGCFELEVVMDESYPLSPLKIRFVTKILHPNVDKDTGEFSFKEHSPVITLIHLLLSIASALDDPDFVNFDSPANAELARLHADDPAEYERVVKKFTQLNAK